MHRNQKGFLIALCLCLLSVSGIAGLYQYQKGKADGSKTEIPKQTAQVEENQEPENEAANSRGTVARPDTQEKENEQAKIETEEDIYEIGEAQLAEVEKAPEETPEEAPQEEQPEEPAETASAQPQFAFADENTLLWPVDGDVIMNYSMDKSIYFSTLNQYKYHPAIVISADVGSKVQCAADGIVTQIKVDEETGTTLTMDLGDGYEAIYGQLKELAVEEGDTVRAGELIGYVSEPTKYYTLEGSNLYFQLLKDGTPANPMRFIE